MTLPGALRLKRPPGAGRRGRRGTPPRIRRAPRLVDRPDQPRGHRLRPFGWASRI